ncbi:hypothetical protein TGAM01_v204178 [Trichoderma gamsii]|uniref:BZIP transcription factor n=1 Tax=Trichoderma gamsii TaxID=398673 RepID=A0A0W7W3A9_9HYPO|nr:hypothetical protein TGAM01_v204178 [Trichoderma gamsii]PNP46810.1 hypothetical protein TGAMA5MH_01762 [Trichoderma gamsii]PON27229.1 hypothetical protein TGAM01_v204178 [Trichoderma gamsii]
MSDEHDNHSAGHAGRAYPIERSDSSASTTPSDQNESVIHQPIPTRPGPRDSSQYEPEIIRPMSPRRTNEDINKMGEEAREELRKHAKALQESLLTIFNRIEAVREEHDKLDNNNKFLQKYIGDLMSTSKITATGSRGKK